MISRLLFVQLVMAVLVVSSRGQVSTYQSGSGYQLQLNSFGQASPSGGTAAGVNSNPGGSFSNPYALSGGSYGGYAGGNISASCSGQTSWTWVWMNAGPPPDDVIVEVSSSAGWNGRSGGCDDGYGDTVVPVLIPPPANVVVGGNTFGTHYFIYHNPGSSFTLQLTPSSSVSSGSCGVGISMSITDVRVAIRGGLCPNTTYDECLPGQYQAATITAGSYLTNSTIYLWNIAGGNPMSSVDWGTNSAPKHIWHAMVSPTITQSPLFFEAQDGRQACSCSATAYAPDGSEIGTVSGHYPMNVVAPGFDIYDQKTGPTTLEGPAFSPSRIEAGNSSGSGTPSVGYFCHFDAETPPEFLSDSLNPEGSGEVMSSQKINWYSVVDGLIFPIINSSNGWALDSVFPYDPAAPAPPSVTPYVFADSPSVTLLGPLSGSVQVTSSYQMFCVFRPPVVSGLPMPEFVPLKEQAWLWNTSDGGALPWPPPSGDPALGGSASWPINDFTWDHVF